MTTRLKHLSEWLVWCLAWALRIRVGVYFLTGTALTVYATWTTRSWPVFATLSIVTAAITIGTLLETLDPLPKRPGKRP